jgi:hypothetical protein
LREEKYNHKTYTSTLERMMKVSGGKDKTFAHKKLKTHLLLVKLAMMKLHQIKKINIRIFLH